jgi:hypothetical protein
MLVSSFNLLQSFNYASYLFCKKLFKQEINGVPHVVPDYLFVLFLTHIVFKPVSRYLK